MFIKGSLIEINPLTFSLDIRLSSIHDGSNRSLLFLAAKTSDDEYLRPTDSVPSDQP